MKIKTSELQGVALDWAVAKCEQYPMGIWYDEDEMPMIRDDEVPEYKPSTDWAQGGPIIEREELSNLKCYGTGNWECNNGPIFCGGQTPLVAAMRCYVASRLGDEVEVPEELK